MMAEKHPKRPRDINQWAKRMVDIATGEVSDKEPTPLKEIVEADQESAAKNSRRSKSSK